VGMGSHTELFLQLAEIVGRYNMARTSSWHFCKAESEHRSIDPLLNYALWSTDLFAYNYNNSTLNWELRHSKLWSQIV
jgi:capsule polysaccharide modification protein KpsS